MYTILIIDDETAQREAIAGLLSKRDYNVISASSGTEGIDALKSECVDLVLTDFRMPGISGGDVLREVMSINPLLPVVVMTAFGSVESAVELMKQGAFDYLQKPIEPPELLHVIERARERSCLISENRMLREELAQRFSFDSIVSHSDEMEAVLNIAGRVAPSRAAVLIQGESGTGKELIARAIHMASDRRDKPFVVINCAALPESLFESELFGHEKGAFTGADSSRVGRFEQADGGTLFIDEVGDIPLTIQVKLLRALQFGQIERVGGGRTLTLDVRVVSATNRNLEQMISSGGFREDLFYRLNVVTVQVPPLRKRKSDIPPLVDLFIQRYAEMNGKMVKSLTREALDALMRYEFPGNIRELENIIQRAVVLTRDETISTRDLPVSILAAPVSETGAGPANQMEPGDLNKQVEALERALIDAALQRTSGNQVKAAELLNISERTLRYKLRKYSQ
jgi:two-component system NtrC family response regulator